MAGLRNLLVKPETLLSLVGTKLGTTDQIVDPNYVYVALDENQQTNPPDTDLYLTVVLGPQRPDQPLITGGGLDTPEFHGQLAVVVWNRLYLDQAGRADSYLKDATLGALEALRKVLKSLYLFDPTDSNSNYYLTDVMRPGDGGWQVKPRPALPNWGCVASTWQCKYFVDLVS